MVSDMLTNSYSHYFYSVLEMEWVTPLIRLSFHSEKVYWSSLAQWAQGGWLMHLYLMCLMFFNFLHSTQLDQLCFINHPEIAVCKIMTPLARAMNNVLTS